MAILILLTPFILLLGQVDSALNLGSFRAILRHPTPPPGAAPSNPDCIFEIHQQSSYQIFNGRELALNRLNLCGSAAAYPKDSEDRWEKIAADVPGKSLNEIKRHYDILIEDITRIDSGRVALPNCSSSLEGATSQGGEDGGGKKGEILVIMLVNPIMEVVKDQDLTRNGVRELLGLKMSTVEYVICMDTRVHMPQFFGSCCRDGCLLRFNVYCIQR